MWREFYKPSILASSIASKSILATSATSLGGSSIFTSRSAWPTTGVSYIVVTSAMQNLLNDWPCIHGTIISRILSWINKGVLSGASTVDKSKQNSFSRSLCVNYSCSSNISRRYSWVMAVWWSDAIELPTVTAWSGKGGCWLLEPCLNRGIWWGNAPEWGWEKAGGFIWSGCGFRPLGLGWDEGEADCDVDILGWGWGGNAVD